MDFFFCNLIIEVSDVNFINDKIVPQSYNVSYVRQMTSKVKTTDTAILESSSAMSVAHVVIGGVPIATKTKVFNHQTYTPVLNWSVW